tara:strand:- start:12105 stop:12293 length:189 start_codon:yes stop_codon:yes gene_type:complete
MTKINSIKIKKGTQSEKDVDDFKDWILTKANQLGFSVEIKDVNIDEDLEARNGVSLCDNCDD